MSRKKTWQATEREVCEYLGIKHVGGPGQPDCSGGSYIVEVKDHERRVGVSTVRSTLEKEWALDLPLLIVSTSGFTDGAIDLADEYGDVFLYDWLSGDEDE